MSIQVIEAPTEFHKPTVFLAGSISGAADWQAEFLQILGEYFTNEKTNEVELIALNPRREHFDVTDETMTDKQIEWEYRHLRRADAIAFWFSHETLAPITLLEFGAHTPWGKPIFIGVHPNYHRRKDVEVQCRLIRPDIRIVYDLAILADQVYGWFDSFRYSRT